jgi:phosphate transport system permease protein
MAIRETDANERVEPEPAAAWDPSLSPAEGHVEHTHTHTPIPRVGHQHHVPAPAPIDQVDKKQPRGVKLAKISQTGDRVFRTMASTAGLAIVLLVLFVGIFLLALALPSLQANQDNFFTSRNWKVSGADLAFGIAGLLWTTILSSVLAMAIAVPVAVGVALCLTQYLHKRASGPVSFVVDLLAAVPSIIFGLWGLTVLGPFLAPGAEWLISKVGWIPLFSENIDPKGSVFVAAVVLAIMVLPIVSAISRDVFAQTPRE